MSATLIRQETPQIAGFTDKSDLIVLTIGAKRKDGGHITDAQKDAAMNSAKAVLQMIGAEVEASSSAFLINESDLAEGETLTVKTYVELWKSNE
ncbi:MAG: hypothetical protein IJM30_13015 [Thermoguttaceae bacterium]|nr:hypothetical protein [Thermoguttaceae bacterium]